MTTSHDTELLPLADGAPAGRPHRRRFGGAFGAVGLAVAAATVVALLVAAAVKVLAPAGSPVHVAPLGVTGWPQSGQASLQIEGQKAQLSPGQRPAPIASLAKVMTALLVLRAEPLQFGQDGPAITVTDADVADTAQRRGRDESLVRVRSGEVLSERQALDALLLPSANNVAQMLAERIAGSVPAFVERMNATARGLGMTHTRYTDPSGFDARTVSTASDQLRLAQVAMRDETFRSLVSQDSASIPVQGTIHNTDTLLGKDGFVGIKTGSDDAAGGCFMFRTYRIVDNRTVAVTGVVMGQAGKNLIAVALGAASELADRVSRQVPMA